MANQFRVDFTSSRGTVRRTQPGHSHGVRLPLPRICPPVHRATKTRRPASAMPRPRSTRRRVPGSRSAAAAPDEKPGASGVATVCGRSAAAVRADAGFPSAPSALRRARHLGRRRRGRDTAGRQARQRADRVSGFLSSSPPRGRRAVVARGLRPAPRLRCFPPLLVRPLWPSLLLFPSIALSPPPPLALSLRLFSRLPVRCPIPACCPPRAVLRGDPV